MPPNASRQTEKGEAEASPFPIQMVPLLPVTGPAGRLPNGAPGNQPPQTWVTVEVQHRGRLFLLLEKLSQDLSLSR
jgi:hypothetical protein